MSDDFDLVVIGAGPAGEKGGAQAAYFGKRVAIVERESEPGGGAVHTGTLPSKTLRETALFLSGYRQRDLYGVTVHVSPDLETPRIRRNLDRHGIELVHGTGCFVDAHTVEVSGEGAPRKLEAEVFLIATGSRPLRLPGVPYEDPDVHDSDTILWIDHVPESLTVLGGGVIGCEYASVFAALGVRVPLVERRSGLLPFLDLELGDRLREAMAALGVVFHFGDGAEEGRRVGGRGLLCTLTSGGRLSSEKVLVTSGRIGNTEALDLAAAGVQTGERGHGLVGDDYRTTAPGVYAAGDVIGFPALASTSMEQARVAVCLAFGFAYKRQVSSLLPYGVYTIPEISMCGESEESCQQKGLEYLTGVALYANNARGQIIGDTDGLVKLLFAPRDKKLLGVHIIGENAA